MWQSLVMIDRGTAEIGAEKKTRKKIETPAAKYNGRLGQHSY